MKAKKSLGQHFLKSEEALSAIIEAGELSGGDIVLEIGPGTGILTEKLLERAGRVFAVEKDARFARFLHARFRREIENEKLVLVSGDALNFDPEIFADRPYKIIANIPYYITGAILKKFLASPSQPEKMVLLVQKEVAQRIIARDSKESVLSMSVKLYGRPEIALNVPAVCFQPKPKVDSAVIVVNGISRKNTGGISEEKFFETLKRGFSHKRKTLLNNFEEPERRKIKKYLAGSGRDEKTRAEELKLEDWIRLAALLG